MPDLERQRTYDAEIRAFEGTLVEAPLTLAEVRDLTRDLTASVWWQRHGSPVTVTRGQGAAIHSRFCPNSGRISLSEAQQNPATLAHELAHAASDDAHGPRFRSALCAIVEALCGADPAATLRAEFDAAGLPVATTDLDGLPGPPLLARHPRFAD